MPPATGFPQAIAGLKRHCRAAATATASRAGSTLARTSTSETEPSAATVILQLELAFDAFGLGGDRVLELGPRHRHRLGRLLGARDVPALAGRRRPGHHRAPHGFAACARTRPRRPASAPRRRPPRVPRRALLRARSRRARRRCSSPARSPPERAPPACGASATGAGLGAVATTRGAWRGGGGGGGGLGGSAFFFALGDGDRDRLASLPLLGSGHERRSRRRRAPRTR